MIVLCLRLAAAVLIVTLVEGQARPFQCQARQGREPNLSDDACATYYVCSNYSGQLRRCQNSQQFDFSDRTCKGDSEVWCNQQLRTSRRRQTTPNPKVNTTAAPENTTAPAAPTARDGLVNLLGALFPQLANNPAGVPGIVGLQGNAPGGIVGLVGNAGLIPGAFGQPDGGPLGDGVAGPFGLRGVVPQQANQIPVFINAQAAYPNAVQFPAASGVNGNVQNPGLEVQGAGGMLGGNGFGQLQPNNGNPQVNPLLSNGFNIIQIQPNQAFPAQPNQAFPAQPNQAFPAQPKQAFPAQPNQAYPAQPNQAYPAQPNQQQQQRRPDQVYVQQSPTLPQQPSYRGNAPTAPNPGQLQPNLNVGQQNQLGVNPPPALHNLVPGVAGQFGTLPPNDNQGIPGQAEPRNNYIDHPITVTDITPDGPAEFFPKIFNTSQTSLYHENETAPATESDRPRVYNVASGQVLNESESTLDESTIPRELFRAGREARENYRNVNGRTDDILDLNDYLERALQGVLKNAGKIIATKRKKSGSDSQTDHELLKININKLASNLISDYAKIKPLLTSTFAIHFQEALHQGRLDDALHIFKLAGGLTKKILASGQVHREVSTDPTLTGTQTDFETRNSSASGPESSQSSPTRDEQFTKKKPSSFKSHKTPNDPSRFRHSMVSGAGKYSQPVILKTDLRSTNFWKPSGLKVRKRQRSNTLGYRTSRPRSSGAHLDSSGAHLDASGNILQENDRSIMRNHQTLHEGANVRLTVGKEYTLEVNDLQLPMKLNLDSKRLHLSLGQKQEESYQRYRVNRRSNVYTKPVTAESSHFRVQSKQPQNESNFLDNYAERVKSQWWYYPEHFNRRRHWPRQF
ncbi:unnamed protein product [Lymnaea stagnalis]|uniref:Chitin-binding type-2 domain-containing protein n=1 Tax=Lymnaea stagnalis TaxID=6523 RepID=A0AAV2HCG5_LYMST